MSTLATTAQLKTARELKAARSQVNRAALELALAIDMVKATGEMPVTRDEMEKASEKLFEIADRILAVAEDFYQGQA